MTKFAGCRATDRCRASERVWMRGVVSCGPVDTEKCMGGRCCEYSEQGDPALRWNPDGASEESAQPDTESDRAGPSTGIDTPSSAKSGTAASKQPAAATESSDKSGVAEENVGSEPNSFSKKSP